MLPHHSGADFFRFKGKKLLGVFSRPAGPEDARFPAVLFLHGFPGSEKSVDIQRELLKRGVASYALNFAGAWGSEGFYSISGLIEQGRAGLRHLQGKSCIDAGRTAVFGFSMGGWTAIHVGEREPGLKAVAAVAPAGGADMLGRGLRDAVFHLSACLRIRSKESLYRDFVAAVSAHDPAASAGRLRCPLLLVHGTADTVVPPAISDRIYAAAGRSAKLVRAPGARHDFLDRREWLTGLVADWLGGALGLSGQQNAHRGAARDVGDLQASAVGPRRLSRKR